MYYIIVGNVTSILLHQYFLNCCRLSSFIVNHDYNRSSIRGIIMYTIVYTKRGNFFEDSAKIAIYIETLLPFWLPLWKQIIVTIYLIWNIKIQISKNVIKRVKFRTSFNVLTKALYCLDEKSNSLVMDLMINGQTENLSNIWIFL